MLFWNLKRAGSARSQGHCETSARDSKQNNSSVNVKYFQECQDSLVVSFVVKVFHAEIESLMADLGNLSSNTADFLPQFKAIGQSLKK